MTKATPKKKAPVQLTAGTGFRNENCIAARFLLDLLAGTNSLGEEFGKIERVQWQGRDLGWLADDLVIECSSSTGKRAASISIKSDRRVTAAGFPPDFVATAWAQWFGVKTERVLSGSDDAVVLMVGSLSHDVEDAWSNLLSDALRTTPERMLARLAESASDEGTQSSTLQRALFASLCCPDELRNGGDASDSAALQLLRRVRLMRFDFEATPSRDQDRALRDCQNVLRSGDAEEAKSLWSRLVAIADANRAGGSLDLSGLLAELRGEFDLRDHPDYRRDWEVLDRLSRELMADIRSQISGLAPLLAMKPGPRCSTPSTGTAHVFLSASPEAGSPPWLRKSAKATTPGACGVPKPRLTATLKRRSAGKSVLLMHFAKFCPRRPRRA